jgi:hypothetical protein
MTILEEDLKTIKTVLMQYRGAYHVSNTDRSALKDAWKRITNEINKETIK